MKNQYDSMTLANLRELAKEKGLKNITSRKKSELIESLIRTDSEIEQEKSEKQSAESTAVKPAQNKSMHNKSVKNNKEEQADSEPVKAQRLKAEQPKKEQIKHEQMKPEQSKTEQPAAEPEKQKPERGKAEPSRPHSSRPEQVRLKQTRPEQVIMKQTRPEQVRNDRLYQEHPRTEQVREEQSGIEQMQMKMEQGQADSREERRNPASQNEMEQLDSGETKNGILEVLPDGYGFIRCDNYLPGENDVYVSPAQIRRFNLKTGDIVAGNTRIRNQNEKFSALLYIKSVNGFLPNEAQKRKRFEELTPIFPNNRIHLETPGTGVAMRMVDLISPIGKGQRGMIVSQPKAGKTTLLKQIARAITSNHPDMKLIILLIDERPEEVTDIKESIEGRNVEVIYSTFDELPENHKRVSEMVIERAKRLVEHKQDVIILLDSITRLARAYNQTVQPSGRTLTGGLDPAALHMPKKFFGAARNMREGGSLTILATALVETGSRMDDVVFEEFKGTGNMELVLDRSLSEKRIFPAIDLQRSSTRRDDLLLTQTEMEATFLMRKALSGMKSDDALERIIDMFIRTKTNVEFIETIKKTRIVY